MSKKHLIIGMRVVLIGAIIVFAVSILEESPKAPEYTETYIINPAEDKQLTYTENKRLIYTDDFKSRYMDMLKPNVFYWWKNPISQYDSADGEVYTFSLSNEDFYLKDRYSGFIPQKVSFVFKDLRVVRIDLN